MTARAIKTKSYRPAFTLAELLMALMVTSIILSAVASLAFALSTAKAETENISENQAHLRFTTMKVTELVKYSRHVILTDNSRLALWQADTNNDNAINGDELVYIEASADGTSLDLMDFPDETTAVTLADIKNGTARVMLMAMAEQRSVSLIPVCSSIQITISATNLANVSFQIIENEVSQSYQIAAAPLCSAANLIDGTGELVAGDDD
jgi:prepilin-type N-terminal cleavage/methylation domain-containing protein